MDRIANAHANERVRDRLCDQDGDLARLAAIEPYRDFDARLADWVRRADENGTCDQAQRNHENRDAKLVQDFDQSWKLSGGCASLQGLELHDILQRFIDAEFTSDWAKARATHGEAATVEDLARTDNQRRFDALFEIFQRAAGSLPGRGGSLVVTNLIIDLVTFERICRRMTDAPVDLDPRLAELLRTACDRGDDTGDADAAEEGRSGGTVGPADRTGTGASGDDRSGVGYRCSGIDGQPLDPTEAVANALTGHIRRVIIDTDSACGKHNRHKERGFTAWRDDAGQWHTLRPDGTEID